jgi:putative lipase involved disintegration of autophagic bodies
MIVALLVASTVATKFMHLQLTPSLYGIILHVVFHFGILALVLYAGELTDKLSIAIAVIFYISAFVMTLGSHSEPSV